MGGMQVVIDLLHNATVAEEVRSLAAMVVGSAAQNNPKVRTCTRVPIGSMCVCLRVAGLTLDDRVANGASVSFHGWPPLPCR